jgi:hypothetical protein
LREEHRMRVVTNRLLRKIFSPKRDEMIRVWRKLYEKLNDLYTSPNIIRVAKSRRTRWQGRVARMEKRYMHTGFWWETLRKKIPFGSPRRRWENNIKMCQ